MADAFTAKLNLTKPEVGASTDTWGTKLNADLDTIDGLFDTGPYLKVANGGTGAGTAATARTNLGLGSLATLSTVTATEISSDAVTTDKILDANITTAKIADGAVSGAKIAMGSDAQGDVMYYNGTAWARLGAGNAGEALVTGGTGANPAWGSSIATGTTAATTSGSSVTVTSIPTWAKKITMILDGVVASDQLYIRVQDSTGTISSGYATESFSSGGTTSSTTDFRPRNQSAGSGSFTLYKSTPTSYTGNFLIRQSAGSGRVTTTDEVVGLVIGTLGTFSAGSVTVLYE